MLVDSWGVNGGDSDGDMKTMTDIYMSDNANRIFDLGTEVSTLYKKKKDKVRPVNQPHELGVKPEGGKKIGRSKLLYIRTAIK